MKTGRLHLRVDEVLLKKVRRIAKKKGLTLTTLVVAGFHALVEAEKEAARAVPDAEQI